MSTNVVIAGAVYPKLGPEDFAEMGMVAHRVFMQTAYKEGDPRKKEPFADIPSDYKAAWVEVAFSMYAEIARRGGAKVRQSTTDGTDWKASQLKGGL